MKKHKRALFFWFLTALFLIVAPASVFYAKGYRFDFDRGVFVYSGIISIKSNPTEVDIYINGKLKNSDINRINNSVNVEGLMPGEYDLTIKAEGFQDWNKKVRIHSGLATEFWNIILVKNEYEKTEYLTPNINDRIFTSPSDDFIAYTEDTETGMKVKILNIKENLLDQEFEIPNGNYSYQEQKENIEWSPKEDFISVPVKIQSDSAKKISTTQKAYFIINPEENTLFNLNKFLNKDEIRNVRWDPEDKNYLFFLSENSLYRSNVSDAEDLKIIAQDVSSFDLSYSGIYYSQIPNELIFKVDLNGEGNRKQITTNFPQELSTPNEKLIVYNDSKIVFINQNKDLFIYNEDKDDKIFRKLAGNIEGIQFSNDGKKLLYWSENEISTYFLNDWDVQPIRLANEDVSLTRFSEKIDNVQWFRDYEHVIFSVGNQFKIIELDPRSKKNIMDLPRVNPVNSIAVYNHALKILFFTDMQDEANQLFSIIFPEKTTFLGF